MIDLNRQTQIAGWNQTPISDASVLIVGQHTAGILAAWTLQCMGIGRVVVVGEMNLDCSRFGMYFFDNNRMEVVNLENPVSESYELEFLANGVCFGAIIVVDESIESQFAALEYAQQNRIPCWFGSARQGGEISHRPIQVDPGNSNPVAAMACAALLVDLVRGHLSPLFDDEHQEFGKLPFELDSGFGQRKLIAQVGVGGIGIYSAFLFSQMGTNLYLIDFDEVESSNLNRQGLFQPDDIGANKAEAASRTLKKLFPDSQIDFRNTQIDEESALDHLNRCQPDVMISAVDNAATRLAIQQAGWSSNVPVVQAGTDWSSADCFAQSTNSPTLDEQMHGALSAARLREHSVPSTTNPCGVSPAYVVPGMMGAAAVVYQTIKLCTAGETTPIRWRIGSLPQMEAKEQSDGQIFAFKKS